MEDGTDASSAFLDALRTRAMDEMLEASLEYGIILKDLGEQYSQACLVSTLMSIKAVIDRQFKGEIAHTMDKLTSQRITYLFCELRLTFRFSSCSASSSRSRQRR